jgi:hypothetical protein
VPHDRDHRRHRQRARLLCAASPFGRREHTFAGVDVALTPWPGRDLQLAAIRRDLSAVLLPRLCVLPVDGGRIDYRLDNVGAGHMFPSGATADRRAWIEIVAYDAAGGGGVLDRGRAGRHARRSIPRTSAIPTCGSSTP